MSVVCLVLRPDTLRRTAAQRALLDQAKALAKRGALIPAHKSYVVQLHRYEHWTRQAGLSHLHGLRHAYAQDRFLELAGFPCPAMGGPSRAHLMPEQREADYDARVIISSELGHSRRCWLSRCNEISMSAACMSPVV